MITEWFLGWAAGIIRFLVELMPDWSMPPEISDPGGLLDTILANAAGVGVWIDWAALCLLAMIPFGVWLIGIAWKSLRTAFSHFPFIGGSG